MANIVTAFFSLRGEPSPEAKAAGSVMANTEVAARLIQRIVGGGIVEIVPAKEYPKDNVALFDQTRKELDEGAVVEPKAYPESVADCDILFIGFPNWWDHLPRVVSTFLAHYSWTGKKIIPFCTSEGSGLGESVNDIKKICKGAQVDEGASFSGSQIRGSAAQVVSWAKGKMVR